MQQYTLWFLTTGILCKKNKQGISETWMNVGTRFGKPVSTAFMVSLLSLLPLTEPVSMAPPSVSPLSPHSLNVSWEKPADNVTRGDVVGYEINMISEQSPQQPAPVVFSQVLLFSHSVLSQLNYIFSLTFSEFTEFFFRHCLNGAFIP